MKTLFVTLTMLALAVTAFAYPGPDSMGMYLDADASGYPTLTYQTAAPFESVTLHLVISNPSLGAVSGWEARIETVGTPIAPAWALSAGLDVDADPNNFQVGIGESPLALTPNGNGNVLVASWTGFVSGTTDEIQFLVMGAPGSASFPDSPGYAGSTAGELHTLVSSTGGPTFPVFCINTDCAVVANEDMTFTNVKSLYR
jgi:hypothetical protein